MPYDKISSGKNKGKYRNKENGSIKTLGQIQAYHAKGKSKGGASVRKK